MKKLSYLCLMLLSMYCMTSCTEEKGSTGLPRIPFKEYLNHTDKISIGTDEIKHIEYVPLELTDDDASLIGTIVDIAMTDNFFFVQTFEDFKLFQFGRDGKYIRTITQQGDGPGRLQTPGFTIWTDEKEQKLYVSEAENISVFTFDGKFEKKINRQGRWVNYAGGDGLDWVAETYRENFPFDIPPYFGIGTFRYQDRAAIDTLSMKKDYWDLSVAPLEKTNFFMGCFIQCQEGYRYGVSCNDTLFTMTREGIEPFLIMDRGASSAEKKLYFETHMESHPELIYIRHACETPKHLYFRFFNNGNWYLLSYEKSTGKVLCQKTDISLEENQDYDEWPTYPGIENEVNGGLPMWFKNWNPQTNIAIQPTSGATIAWMKEEGMIKNLPDCLKDYPEDGNPVVAVYQFK